MILALLDVEAVCTQIGRVVALNRCTRTRARARAHTHTHIHTCTHMHTHTHTHTHTCTHMHAHARTHAHAVEWYLRRDRLLAILTLAWPLLGELRVRMFACIFECLYIGMYL